MHEKSQIIDAIEQHCSELNKLAQFLGKKYKSHVDYIMLIDTTEKFKYRRIIPNVIEELKMLPSIK